MRIRTTRCKQFRHPEFNIDFDLDQIVEADATSLLSYLEASVETGQVFKHDETLQTGWMLNLLQRDGKDLILCEPDFVLNPIEWVGSITKTLAHLRLQKDVCESFEIFDCMFPTIVESAIVGLDVDETCKRYVLERVEPDNCDSGWFVGALDPQCNYNDASNLTRTSLYEIAISHPSLVPFFALPPGSNIRLQDGVMEFRLNGTLSLPNKGSLVARQFQKRPDVCK